MEQALIKVFRDLKDNKVLRVLVLQEFLDLQVHQDHQVLVFKDLKVLKV